ncbi:MAG: Na+/H+ antiporter NhaC family protein [Oscillospiraceae bacterium]|nr:Na+/H+ antiporter NhaC family protein [Oscillospiraceae bacterium]
MEVYGTIFSLLPPIIAIGLALITKEVYSSLFAGALVGALLYSGFNIVGAIEHIFVTGMVGTYGEVETVSGVLTDPYNMGILVFLVLLGVMGTLMNRAGGSAAFARWASTHVKSRAGAQLATIALGCLIFVDDYFNCLTVGSVMRPVTDAQGISRAKLAYCIDATAAPICIIAPISSWAAAVSGFVEGTNGLTLFVRSIPYNFYAILTIVMLVVLSVSRLDYGPMRRADEQGLGALADEMAASHTVNEKGRVMHLVVPVIALIVSCVVGMVYTGGFFDGVDFITAFSNCDASVGLMLGSFVAVVFTVVFYLVTRVLSFRDCMSSLPDGFKTMVPAILILALAWTLKSVTDSLGASEYVAALVDSAAHGEALMSFLPAIVFLVGVGLSFATGTSWGTFGILIPIVVDVFNASMSNELMIISISACLAGAVCGDHCSPISDTTIMASAGAQCDHVMHVSTQLPYAMTVAGVSLVCYIIAGFVQSAWVMLPLGIVLMIGTLLVIRNMTANRA